MNIKQSVLEETFHKLKSILGRHQEFHTMKLKETKLKTQAESTAVGLPHLPYTGVTAPRHQLRPGSWQVCSKCPRCIIVPKFMFTKMVILGDIPGGPVVGTPPSSAGAVGSIPGRGAGIPPCLGARKPRHRTEATL